jgi:hypothetical protein
VVVVGHPALIQLVHPAVVVLHQLHLQFKMAANHQLQMLH